MSRANNEEPLPRDETNSAPAPLDGLPRLLSETLDAAAPAPLLRPIRPSTASGEAVDRLLTAIAMGEFLPGERIPAERTLAQLLGISRATLREALGHLDQLGVTAASRGRAGGRVIRAGWVDASADAVRHILLPRKDEIEQMLDLRARFEELVGRTAAERITRAGVEEVRRRLEEYAHSKNLREEQTADAQFHGAILDATGNAQMVALSRDLLVRASIAFPREPWGNDQMPVNDPDFRDALEDHRQIYEALQAGDVERVGRLCREHVRISGAMFRAVARQADP